VFYNFVVYWYNHFNTDNSRMQEKRRCSRKLHAGLLLPTRFKMFLSAPHKVGQCLETDSYCEYTQGKPGIVQMFCSAQCSQNPG